MSASDEKARSGAQIKEEKPISSAPKNLMVPFLLLSLRGWNVHGYELIQQLIKFGFPSIDQGNVYRTLRQLEKEKMVKSEWDTSAGGPAKRVYSLTDAGEQYLKSWAASLEQYQTMLDRFFDMYTQFFMLAPKEKNKAEKEEKK
ncbi:MULTISPECIES: poly-beta-hydroxybutyrate-responsive repressor [Aneurinibacillus]|uniref:Poly-beta-hydroxybutyrate-responsive repressor n=1 Tax=Aneurinibacillus thermoaerophilus TaxID=143495 RepID=A0A1G7YNY1_ANETH|nr:MULTISPECIES: poly-beta-hydroxybutyrate-responsive repressor [Aneurinibacillus]AMA73791.1 PadR family transcriptional regulator [Aneurinibacillus sp. XH2]MED0676621.1 poly-beta-hydroxybutyrate-responsive repressor [Aneurinibacillus thermoaerophilus]MED0679392.1 poly-beta-hydroxybutyrate-responsive repressor [Aneurinibacillus thermoaerophilus]MED0738037.1 poly-beta-hydroxybutyrate-responsive repressor [Aneurinibacillus thermoaerophilus]MED0756458.1 poly-beta-hydroxybutyrate-responsive repres